MSGSLCSDLCEQNNFHLGRCLSTVPEKKIYDADWKGREVILKVNMSWFEEFAKRQNITDNDAVILYKNDISFRVRTLFGDCPRCSELTSVLMSFGDGNSDGTITGSEARTFISLLQHIEPMMLMALNGSKHTVDFYGYCGGLYAVEEMPYVASKVFLDTWELLDLCLPDFLLPLQEKLNYFAENLLHAATFYVQYAASILSDTLSWTKYPIFYSFFGMRVSRKHDKFKFAYSMLDATLDVSDKAYGLVQSCDGHLENYGITNESVVKIIDFDLMYPYAFIKTILEQKKCASDSECWAGNNRFCLSTCDANTGSCTSLMRFQDLHLICEVLFPAIFSDTNILEPPTFNRTYLTRAISKLGVFCSKLPVVYSVEELRHYTVVVKKKLSSIEMKLKEK